MTLYEFLSTLKTNIKVVITKDEETYEIFSNSVDGLDEFLKDALVQTWAIDRNTITVILETILSV